MPVPSPLVMPIAGTHPQLPRFLAPNATLIGDITFGLDCSVWFGAVIRADINRIVFGDRCNVQDLCVVHLSRRLPCIMADEVSLGHGAIVHACTIGCGTLVGMGGRVLDGAQIGDRCLVAAGCVVPEGMVVPDGHLVAGVPGKIIKPLAGSLVERIGRIAGDYVAYQQLYPSILAEACAP